MKTKLKITLVTAIALITSLGGGAWATSSEGTDFENHWAETAIIKAIDAGILKGYPDGNIKPDKNMTRAEFFSMVNNAFNYTQLQDISFADVPEVAWFAPVIKKGFAAGYIDPVDGFVRPNDKITRQEVAIYLSEIKSLSEPTLGSDMVDLNQATPEGRNAILKILETKIMQGTPDNRFLPKAEIKRSEALTALINAMTYDSGNQVYRKSGVYGTKNVNQVVRGDVIVEAGDVSLVQITVNGDLIISKKAGLGTVTLEGVTVKGDIVVNGGQKVEFKNVIAEGVFVHNEKSQVTVITSGDTTIKKITATTDVELQETGYIGDGFKTIMIQKSLMQNVKIRLVRVKVEYAQIQASGITFSADEASAITNLTIDGENTVIKGQAEITKAEIRAKGITFEKKPKLFELSYGMPEPTIIPVQTAP